MLTSHCAVQLFNMLLREHIQAVDTPHNLSTMATHHVEIWRDYGRPKSCYKHFPKSLQTFPFPPIRYGSGHLDINSGRPDKRPVSEVLASLLYRYLTLCALTDAYLPPSTS